MFPLRVVTSSNRVQQMEGISFTHINFHIFAAQKQK